MNDNEREMDLALAEAEQENRLLRARNERLERELAGQVALNKMADNARELGLNYDTPLSAFVRSSDEDKAEVMERVIDKAIEAQKEKIGCVNHDCDKCKAQPAVQEGRDWSLLAATQESLREHMAEIKRLKATQPAPVQHDECVVCGDKVRVIPRPWVGLTDEERLTEAERHLGEMHVENCGLNNIKDFAQAIEAKLKEKNT
jgi:hypothetical protein